MRTKTRGHKSQTLRREGALERLNRTIAKTEHPNDLQLQERENLMRKLGK